MSLIRKIIREQIEALVNLRGSEFNKTLQNEIQYLEELEFVNYKHGSKKEAWVFHGKKGIAVFKVAIIHLGSDNWEAFVSIKDDATDFSKKIGKKEMGPFDSLEEMVKHLNDKLSGDLLWGIDMYKDDINQSKENIIKDYLQKPLNKEEELMAIENPNLDRLKKVFIKFKKLKERKSIDSIIEILANDFKDHDNLIWILQDTDKIGFYKKLKKF